MRIHLLALLIGVCIGAGLLTACSDGTSEPAAPPPQVEPPVDSGAAITETYDDADNWNYPNDNYFGCATLKNPTAPMRYEDMSLVSTNGEYLIYDTLTYKKPYDIEKGYCNPGEIRLDAKELLQTENGRIYLHKGGQGYSHSDVPYGHIWIGDLASGTAPSPLVSTSNPPEYGAPSAIPGTDSWDWDNRNGRGCAASGDFDYYIHIIPQGSPDELPATWQYKPDQTSARYNKYADAGAEQGEGTEHYAYLLWSWLTKGDGVTKNPGGGMVRSIMKDGQVFHRCAVKSINSVAYGYGTSTVVGRVTAIYGKTRASSDGPWVYGWMIHSHQPKLPDGSFGARVFHVTSCPDTGC